jgi:hypothetical protein
MTDATIDASSRYRTKRLFPERPAMEALTVGEASPCEAVAPTPGR